VLLLLLKVMIMMTDLAVWSSGDGLGIDTRFCCCDVVVADDDVQHCHFVVIGRQRGGVVRRRAQQANAHAHQLLHCQSRRFRHYGDIVLHLGTPG